MDKCQLEYKRKNRYGQKDEEKHKEEEEGQEANLRARGSEAVLQVSLALLMSNQPFLQLQVLPHHRLCALITHQVQLPVMRKSSSMCTVIIHVHNTYRSCVQQSSFMCTIVIIYGYNSSCEHLTHTQDRLFMQNCCMNSFF